MQSRLAGHDGGQRHQMTDTSSHDGITSAPIAARRWRFPVSFFPLKFHRDLPRGEKLFLAALLGFVLVTGFALWLATPVTFRLLMRGMRLYLLLPLVSVSVVWGVIRLAETFAGHRFAIFHARAQWMVTTALITSLTIPVYGMFKQFILKARGFPFDPLLASVDRILFFGYDPWQVMHGLFGSVWFTLFLDRAYGVWLPILMFCPVLWVALIHDPLVRARLIGCWLGVWVIVGGVAAWLLASAGPMFYPHMIGPEPSFQALHDEIIRLGEQVRAQGSLLATPMGHNLLMKVYFSGNYLPGFGISAMPSVHVSMATLFAIGGFCIHRWLGWAFVGYAILIWIGSIYLGWHYASDGIVGAALTFGLWKLSAQFAQPFSKPAAKPLEKQD